MVSIYHYTSPLHTRLILESGFIKTVESNVSVDRLHAGPDVVWLTRDPVGMQTWMDQGGLGIIDKGRIRFTVDVPFGELHHWPMWADKQGMEEWWKRALIESGGFVGTNLRERFRRVRAGAPADEIAASYQSWHVCERIIPWQEWLTIEDTISGQVWWQQTPQQIAGRQMVMPRSWDFAGVLRRTEPMKRVDVSPETIRRWQEYATQTGRLNAVEVLGTTGFEVTQAMYDKIDTLRKPGQTDDELMTAIVDNANPLMADMLSGVDDEIAAAREAARVWKGVAPTLGIEGDVGISPRVRRDLAVLQAQRRNS